MRTDKALLDFDGVPLVIRIARRLAAVSDDVFVVAKRSVEGVRAVIDAGDVQAPLVGVLTALRTARYPAVFVCACDMPFVNVEIVRMLAARSAVNVDAVVPLRDGGLEGLHSVWSFASSDKIEALLAEGERGLRDALRRLRVDEVPETVWREIDPDARTFTNLNTPEDLKRARALV